jgi:hypothetical protein
MKFCAFLILGLATALSLDSSAEAAKKTKAHTVHGTIVDIQKDNTGATLTVKVQPHHKKGEAAKAPVEKKYVVAKTVPVERVSGKKGNVVHQPAKLADLQVGDHVAITALKNVVEKVTIRANGKKKDA